MEYFTKLRPIQNLYSHVNVQKHIRILGNNVWRTSNSVNLFNTDLEKVNTTEHWAKKQA